MVIMRWQICNYNGLPVCVYRVRVNRYVIVFLNMLTNIFVYGITNYIVGEVATLPIFLRAEINFFA